MTSTLNDVESLSTPDGWSPFDTAVDALLGRARGWRFGGFSHGRGPVRMANADDRAIAVQRLLDELCADLGFYLPMREQARLRQWQAFDADEFTDAVFVADEMDPRLYPHLRSQVQARVKSWLPAIDRAAS
jgi:hypothetical protein